MNKLREIVNSIQGSSSRWNITGTGGEGLRRKGAEFSNDLSISLPNPDRCLLIGLVNKHIILSDKGPLATEFKPDSTYSGVLWSIRNYMTSFVEEHSPARQVKSTNLYRRTCNLNEHDMSDKQVDLLIGLYKYIGNSKPENEHIDKATARNALAILERIINVK